MPTRARLSASLDEAKTIFCLILALSGALRSTRSVYRPSRYQVRVREHGSQSRYAPTRVKDGCLPGNKSQLVPLARALLLKLEIVNRPSALIFREVGHKFIIVGLRRCLFNNNLCVGLVQIENDVFVRFLNLQLLINFQAGFVNRYSGCLSQDKREKGALFPTDLPCSSWSMWA
jgi:hypothetical protein